MLTQAILQQMWPNGNSTVPGLIQGIASTAPALFSKFGLNDDLTIAHAMAQFTVECGGGHEMVENMNYSAQGLMDTWPARFDAAKAAAFAHQPQKIGNEVYNGRMGNAVGSNDGFNFRGRGLAQTTGREAYGKLGSIVSLDLTGHPDLVNTPNRTLECALEDFVTLCKCLPFAQADDVIEVSQHLNGGFVGFADRTTWLVKWKQALGVSPAKSGTMLWVQQSLNTLGASPQLVADSEYGPGSKAALKDFQVANHLQTKNGLPTRETIAAIKAALPSV